VFTYEEYIWAYSVFTSRHWVAKEPAILPLIDSFNFKKESSVDFVQKPDGSIDVISKHDIAEGQEIIVNDGLLGNRDLLEFFGFILDKNNENYMEVGVSLDKDDKLYANKKKKLQEKGLKNGQTFKIKANEISPDLIFALRIYHTNIFDFEDIDNAFKNKIVSSQNELKVAQMLVDLCLETLKSYPTTSREDKDLLKTQTLTRRQRNAVILRRGEKKILTQTLNKARGALQQVESNWEHRSMDIPGTDSLRTTLINPGDEIL